MFYYYHWANTSADGLFMFLLLSLGQYLCWWTIYVFITITGQIPLLVDYLCFYYYRWTNTSTGGQSIFYYYHWANTSAAGLFMFLLPSLGQYLCWWTIYVFITITGAIPLLMDYPCIYYYHWANTSAGGLSMCLLLSMGQYLCWWAIYVCITITGSVSLLVDYLCFITITG
jgi:hypothetical protein